jgi:hypothetical protein
MLIEEIFGRASCSRPPPACAERHLALTIVADINKMVARVSLYIVAFRPRSFVGLPMTPSPSVPNPEMGDWQIHAGTWYLVRP